MRVERLLNTIEEAPVIFSGNIEMVVDLNLDPIIEKHPDQAVCPNHADVCPWNGGDQEAETDNGCRNRLR